MGRPARLAYSLRRRGARFQVTIRPPGAPRETFTAATEAEAAARFVAWLTEWRAGGGALRPAWRDLCAADARAPVGAELRQLPPGTLVTVESVAGAVPAGPVCQVGHLAPQGRVQPQPYRRDYAPDAALLAWADAAPPPRRTVGFQPPRRLLALVEEWCAAMRDQGWISPWRQARAAQLNRRLRSPSAETIYRQRLQVRGALQHLEWQTPADVQRGAFQHWLEKLRRRAVLTRTNPRRHLTQATIHAYHYALQSYLDWLADSGKLPARVELPFVASHHAKRHTYHGEGHSEALCARLPRYCTDPRKTRPDGGRRRVPFRLAAMIIRDTGIRRATLKRLVRDSFKLPPAPGTRGAYLELRGIMEKNDKEGELPLRADTVGELRAVFAAERYTLAELIWGFIGEQGLLQPRIKLPTWNRWLKKCGCPADAAGRYGVHALRKARLTGAVNRARAAGCDLGLDAILHDAGGHRTIENVRSYLVNPDWERAQQLLPSEPLPVAAGTFAVAPDGSLDFDLRRPDGSTVRAHLHAGSPEWSRQVQILETDLGTLAVSPIGGKSPR